MASSTSSVHKSFKYDVFLSFSGEDVRKTFIDHLYAALERKGIYTYMDDERIEKGKQISDELIKSIEDSRFFIIVFSKNYASSSWCLDELVKMMECRKTKEQEAYPVFFDVEPTEVRKQSGAVKKAFAKNKKKKAAGKWREALQEAADLAGWELKNTTNGYEAKFIQKIVEEISLELRSIHFSDDENLVGMERRISDVESVLGSGSDEVRMIGIKGIGGGGKTTLARAVFDKICIQFEGKSFVENVREVSKAYGLQSLQKQILAELLKDQGISVSSVHEGKMRMKMRLHGKKVLIVLDDVDHIDQLEALAGAPDWFGVGSRIIITTRDEQVLIEHRVNLIHDVNLLSEKEAIFLFNMYAFGRDIPIHGYEELSRQVVRYAAGLPLTIRVLGSFLCSKNELDWKDAIERLKTIPLKGTLEKLELSYIGLEDDYKEIFLDVACFLKGWSKKYVTRQLESCGFHARNGLRVLEQKCLITISDRGYLGMHDHIEEMGKNIVRREHPTEPRKHSRLWIQEEIEDILANGLGTKATRCIRMMRLGLSPEIIMKGLGSMKKLRVFCLYSESHDDCFGSNWKFDEVSQYLPNALQYFHWVGYPYLYLPKTFGANNLVALEMPQSRIEQLWEGSERKVLNKLRFLDLRGSNLMTLDLGLTPNLEKLNLQGCDNLVELEMPVGCLKLTSLKLSLSKLRTLSFATLPDLKFLCLSGKCDDPEEIDMSITCQKLRYRKLDSLGLIILDLSQNPNLEKLTLWYCDDLVKFCMPIDGCVMLTDLKLMGSQLSTLDLRLALNLVNLHLEECDELVKLHIPVELKSLYLNSSKLKILDLRMTTKLESLTLNKCHDLEKLHMPFSGFLRLKDLQLTGSKLSTLDPRQTLDLEKLRLKESDELVEFHMPIGWPELTSLNLNHSMLKTLDLGLSSRLETLTLTECRDLEELIMPNNECLNLTDLQVKGSKLRTLDLRLTPNLEDLHLKECDELVELHMPIGCSELRFLFLSHTKLKSLNLVLTWKLKSLTLNECHDLIELHMPPGCPELTFLKINHSKLKNLDLGLTPNLKVLKLKNCHDLGELHMPVGCSELTSFHLNHSKLKTLVLGLTPNLEVIKLKRCHDLVELHMPVECAKLTSLHLNHSKLKILDIGLTPNLQILKIYECHDLVEFKTSIGSLKELVCVEISPCSVFESFFLTKSHELVLVFAESLDSPLDSNHRLPKFWFSCDYEEQASSSTGNPERLISLCLSRSTNLKSFLESICGLRRLRKLTLGNSILEAPKNLDQLESLEELMLFSTDIKHLPDSICLLKHLKSLKIKSCWHLEDLPENLGGLECLEQLHLSSTHIKHVPDSICIFQYLKSLTIDSCYHLEKLPDNLGRLECLEKLHLISTYIRHFPDSICNLKHLKSLTLESCKLLEKLPEDLGRLECLKKLHLDSSYIRHLPDSMCKLKHLKYLKLKSCPFLKKLPEDLGCLECLERLALLSLNNIKHLPDSICKLKHLKSFKLEDCKRLEMLPEDLGQLECLEELYLVSTYIKYLPDSICRLKHLKSLKLGLCFFLKKLPDDLGQLECLENLHLSSTLIERLPDSICMLKHLKSLRLESCLLLKMLPADLGRLKFLESLFLSSTRIKHLPDSFFMLKHLKYLHLHYCQFLEKLPEYLGQLECLEILELKACTSLQDIPNSICNMKRLNYFHLPLCSRVEKLPEELGQLRCLKELNVNDTGVNHLPQSILRLKGLCIEGSISLLQSCGFSPEIETSVGNKAYCYI